ncbi:hypothetical protein CRENBAI_022535 [Crenichthys baileyi]|uniref:Uncharacterized protein n=1 Tax=Crenichthys baileyi TaxID=28760 RepID=A0AAV9SA23_9TELE
MEAAHPRAPPETLQHAGDLTWAAQPQEQQSSCGLVWVKEDGREKYRRLVFLKLFIWQAKNLNRSSSSSGVASEHRAEDGMGGAAASLGNFAVAEEDAGILAAALHQLAGKPPPRQPTGC